ncbi:MAG: hypothetical protein ACR5LC_13080 [Symbiopectobacterium sp.]|uniref:hypothetical protein n=1 Tax=Symbiopectobacterium sp. TaxID=2952789 RepID=UPI003F4035F4
MDQQAENQSPDVEIEEQSTEQTPDDAGQHSYDGGEQSQNNENQPEPEDDDEEEFYFGDEKLGSPTSEEGKDPALVRHLRNTIKEKARELKELRTKSPQQQAPTQAPHMPQLSDDGIDYDESAFQKQLSEWSEENAKYQAAQAQQQQAQQVA